MMSTQVPTYISKYFERPNKKKLSDPEEKSLHNELDYYKKNIIQICQNMPLVEMKMKGISDSIWRQIIQSLESNNKIKRNAKHYKKLFYLWAASDGFNFFSNIQFAMLYSKATIRTKPKMQIPFYDDIAREFTENSDVSKVVYIGFKQNSYILTFLRCKDRSYCNLKNIRMCLREQPEAQMPLQQEAQTENQEEAQASFQQAAQTENQEEAQTSFQQEAQTENQEEAQQDHYFQEDEQNKKWEDDSHQSGSTIVMSENDIDSNFYGMDLCFDEFF